MGAGSPFLLEPPAHTRNEKTPDLSATMSERMIELRRAKMGLPPMTQPHVAATATDARPGGAAGSITAGAPPPTAGSRFSGVRVLSLSQVNAAALETDDERMHRFLSLLSASSQEADELPDAKPPVSSATAAATTGSLADPSAVRRGPTVPTALSRRMLHRQGAGYLDDNVPAVASAAADRFLATVLQQAAACRDRRLKGEDLSKRERRERRRHRKRRRAELDDRRRIKGENWKKRKDKNLSAVRASDTLSAVKAAASSSGTSSKSKSKKSKKTSPQGNGTKMDGVTNGNKVPSIPPVNHYLSDDSVDEEENYYEDYYGEGHDSADDGAASDESEEEEDDDEESRYALLLRDVQRPLAAWGVTLTGKIGLGTMDPDTHEEEEEEGQSNNDDTGETEEIIPPDVGADDGASSAVIADAASPIAGSGYSPASKVGESGTVATGISSPETKQAQTKQTSKSSPAKASSKK